MATTGVVKGLLLKVFVDDVAITCQTDCSIDINQATTDTTCKDSDPGWEDAIGARKSWSVSGTAYFKFDATKGFSALFAGLTAGTKLEIMLGTGVSGDKNYSGLALVESISLSAGIDDSSQYDYQFKGCGALTEATTA